jgi:hypothetical protein
MRIILTLLVVIGATASIGYILRNSHENVSQVLFGLSFMVAILLAAAFFV